MPSLLAAIPYTTFPEIDLGPVSLRTFGVMFALGVVVGVSIVAHWGEKAGISTDDTVALATRMVIAGVVGSRLTWVATHLSSIDSPLDVIAVWEGGLQYSGGFIAALLIGYPTFRHWDRLTKARMLDAATIGLAAGIAIGRIGCYSVGEHLGTATSFFLGTRYEGGLTREQAVVGEVIHNTALYELLHLPFLVLLLWVLLRRKATPGTVAGIFGVWYSVGRFGTDFLRAYDETVAGLTGAQWTCILVLGMGLYLLLRVRPRMAGRVAAETDETDGPDDVSEDGDDDEDREEQPALVDGDPEEAGPAPSDARP